MPSTQVLRTASTVFFKCCFDTNAAHWSTAICCFISLHVSSEQFPNLRHCCHGGTVRLEDLQQVGRRKPGCGGISNESFSMLQRPSNPSLRCPLKQPSRPQLATNSPLHPPLQHPASLPMSHHRAFLDLTKKVFQVILSHSCRAPGQRTIPSFPRTLSSVYTGLDFTAQQYGPFFMTQATDMVQ